MTLTDYTYIATLGQSCVANFQLARAVMRARFPASRCAGPFDWNLVSIPQALEVLACDFSNYFNYEAITLSDCQDPEDCWTIRDGNGIMSKHQMLRDGTEPVPTHKAWFEFGKWLGIRLQAWNDALRHPSGNVLLVRAEDPFVPDRPEDVLRLVETLAAKVAGRVSLAWVRYASPLPELLHPDVRMFQVRPTWPSELSPGEIDWMRDYGRGLAWRGHDEDWDRVWASLASAGASRR